jgi:hypothetical protein
LGTSKPWNSAEFSGTLRTVEKDKALIYQGFSDFFDCLRTM